MKALRIIGNVIWLILGGWIDSLIFLLLGGFFCITIIGIPIGKACFQYAKLMIWPFGKTIVRETDIKGKENVSTIRRVGGVIANILWLPVGIASFIACIASALVCFISIICIPIGIVFLKISVFLIWPVGAKVVTVEEEKAIQAAKQEILNRQYMQKLSGEAVQPVSAPNGENSIQAGSANPEIAAAKANFSQGVSAVQSSVAAGAANAGAVLKQTGEKASAAAKQYTEQTSSYIQSIYNTNSEAAHRRDMQMSWNSIMEQTEAALFRNPYTAAVLSFLPYVLGVFAVLFVILGIIGSHSFIGIFYGLAEGSIVFVLLGVLFTIQRQYTFSAGCFLGTAGILFLTMILKAILYRASGGYLVLSIIIALLKVVVCAVFGVVSLLLRGDN